MANNLIIKTPNQILSGMLSSLKAGLINAGVSNPQIGEGSDYYIGYSAISNELAVAEQNINIQADALMPDTAVGEDLNRILTIYGLTRRAASTANGSVALITTLDTLVPTDTQLVSTLGDIYFVTIGGIYANNAEIPVQSLSTGDSVNLAVDEVLTWVTTPAYAQSTSTVAIAISGAVDAEDDETVRQRLLSVLQNPPALGNWQQVADMCESFNPVVQKAFIFPACNGPSTAHIALVGYTTDASKSRAIDSYTMTSLEESIKGQLPEYVDTYISTSTDVNVDVSFKLTIPYPLGSLNLGLGGGWLDHQPFPIADSTYKYTAVTVISSTQLSFSVTAATPAPTVGVTHVSWIDRDDNYKVYTATITAATYSSPTYTITLDTPFVGITTGDWIFPSSINQQNYVDTVIADFAGMGPGEKSAVATLLPMAYRKPRANLSYPSAIDEKMLKTVVISASEIFNVEYWYSTYDTDAPDIPLTIESPPNIYVPRHLAFYPPSL